MKNEKWLKIVVDCFGNRLRTQVVVLDVVCYLANKIKDRVMGLHSYASSHKQFIAY